MSVLRHTIRRAGWSRLLFALLIAASGAANGRQAGNTTQPVFEKEILPIFQRSCASCHLGGNAMGKLQLGSEAVILRGGASGQVVAPGNSGDSLLIKRILGLIDAPRMPMGAAPLPAADVKVIRSWVDQMKTGQIKTDYVSTGQTPDTSTANSPLFASTVRPILASRCYSCHGPSLQQNGLRLDSLNSI
ncbi:MAG TPA: c-type cytochrome domain-containing protein, partial [Edaphobacter sp.]|nr:c-type cytochrome domain-containing protein [Edaphobacter sp.]